MGIFHNAVKNVLIETRVKEVLNERLSVSNDVITATSVVYGEICKALENNEFVNNTITFTVNENLGETFNNIATIQVTIVQIDDDKFIRYYVDGDYNKKTHIIRFVFPYYDGKLDEKLTLSAISHELLHAMQYNHGEQKSYKGLYGLATRMSETLTPETPNYDLSYCVYYLDKREIDARCHELAMTLLKDKTKDLEEYSKLYIIRVKNIIKEKLINLNEMPISEYSYALSVFGIDNDKLFNYLNNQMKYLESKFMKVWQWYMYKKDNVHENIRLDID